jgi:hypothetical protein
MKAKQPAAIMTGTMRGRPAVGEVHGIRGATMTKAAKTEREAQRQEQVLENGMASESRAVPREADEGQAATRA